MVDPFTSLHAAASVDERVLGLILGGSRGKGFGVERSDWDVHVVTASGADVDGVRAALPCHDARLDLVDVVSLDDFATHALAGSPEEWNAYNFAHLEPALDRTDGLLKRLCDEKERLPNDIARARATALLDAYVNSYYRSLKNLRDGHAAASRLDASEAVSLLLTFVFTAESRVRPYNKYLSWELGIHPVSRGWWGGADPSAALMHILATGDPAAQADLFRGVVSQARTIGFGEVIDAWGERSVAAMARGSTDT